MCPPPTSHPIPHCVSPECGRRRCRHLGQPPCSNGHAVRCSCSSDHDSRSQPSCFLPPSLGSGGVMEGRSGARPWLQSNDFPKTHTHPPTLVHSFLHFKQTHHTHPVLRPPLLRSPMTPPAIHCRRCCCHHPACAGAVRRPGGCWPAHRPQPQAPRWAERGEGGGWVGERGKRGGGGAERVQEGVQQICKGMALIEG